MYQEAVSMTNTARQLTYVDGGEQLSSQRLKVVRQDHRARSGVLLGIMALIALAVVIIIPLILNTQMAERAFSIRDMQVKINALDAEAWSMQESLARNTAPEILEKNAKHIGMVPAGPTGFISLSKSTIDGGVPAR